MNDESIVRFILRIPLYILTFAAAVALAIAMSEGVFSPWQVAIGLPVGFAIFVHIVDQIVKAPARIRRARQKAYAKKVRAQTDMSN
jgi:peptidoglycan/LPS O-acetylase OafA/YrhL